MLCGHRRHKTARSDAPGALKKGWRGLGARQVHAAAGASKRSRLVADYGTRRSKSDATRSVRPGRPVTASLGQPAVRPGAVAGGSRVGRLDQCSTPPRMRCVAPFGGMQPPPLRCQAGEDLPKTLLVAHRTITHLTTRFLHVRDPCGPLVTTSTQTATRLAPPTFFCGNGNRPAGLASRRTGPVHFRHGTTPPKSDGQ